MQSQVAKAVELHLCRDNLCAKLVHSGEETALTVTHTETHTHRATSQASAQVLALAAEANQANRTTSPRHTVRD